METVLIIIASSVLSFVIAGLLLRYLFHWVNINNIPEKELEEAAKKIFDKKFERVEEEMGELREKEEKRIREMRRESTEHEEILIER